MFAVAAGVHLRGEPTLFPGWCANKSYVIATSESDLWLFIHASNLLPSLPTPLPYINTLTPPSFPGVSLAPIQVITENTSILCSGTLVLFFGLSIVFPQLTPVSFISSALPAPPRP